MSYESTETKEFEMRRDMDILEIFSVTCVICQGHKKREREKLYDAMTRLQYKGFI